MQLSAVKSNGGGRRSIATQLIEGCLAFNRFGDLLDLVYFFSAERYTHMISLLLPSCEGGCQCSKRGCQCSKKGCQPSDTLFKMPRALNRNRRKQMVRTDYFWKYLTPPAV